ncbi:hypothetical protein BSKO_06383 [Bryopsis sp. KO-2023]|nr:hypothetical protein BSKO_06383 [Bryopsis sp. KO-2023]
MAGSDSLQAYDIALRRKNADLQRKTETSLAAAERALSTQKDVGGIEGSATLGDFVERSIQEVLESVQKGEEKRAEEPAGCSDGEDSEGTRTPMGNSRPSTPAIENDNNELDVPQHSQATLRLHKAKIKALEGQLKDMKEECRVKEAELAEAVRELKDARGKADTGGKAQKRMESQLEKTKQQLNDCKAELTAAKQQVREMSEDTRKGEKIRRQVEDDARNREVRLKRALDEVDRYKGMLEKARGVEREGREVARTDYNKVVAENKRLERQKAELVVAFRKQMKLIDVLRRQKIHMEAARMLSFTEEEFMKILDLGAE